MAKTDANLTIGATFDKGQLDAAMAEGAESIKQIPDKFNLAFREVSTSSQRLLRQISDDTKAATGQIGEQWKKVASASTAYAAAQREVRAATKLTADASLDSAQTLGVLAAAKQKAALASEALAAAEKEAAGSAATEAVAERSLGETLSHLREHLTLTSEGIRSTLFENGGVGGVLGAALGVGILGEYVQKLEESEVQLGLLSSASGIAVGKLAELQSAFNLQGVEVDKFSQVLTRLAEHVAEAQEGDRSMAIYFESLGVTMKDLTNPALKLDDLMRIMGRHLEDNAGNSQDLGAAYALLGRGADQFVGALKGLSKTEADNRDRLDEMKTSAQDAASAAEQLELVEKQIGVTLRALALDALPPVNFALKVLTSAFDIVVGTVKEFDTVVEATILDLSNLFGGLSRAIGEAIHGDFQAASLAMKDIGRQITAEWKGYNATINQNFAETVSNIKNLWASLPDKPPATRLPPTLSSLAGATKNRSDGKLLSSDGGFALRQAERADELKNQLDLDTNGPLAQFDHAKAMGVVQNNVDDAGVKALQASWQSLGKTALASIQDSTNATNKQLLQLNKEPPAIIGLSATFKAAFKGISTGFEYSLRGILEGTQTISQAWHRMASDMVASFAASMAKIEIRNLATEFTLRTAHATTAAVNRATDSVAAASTLATTSVTNTKSIASDAAAAAAKAYKSMAGIPIVGPELGAIAAAGTFAGVMAFQGLASASGGQWRVPIDTQLTEIHRNEMVLPARYAEPLRQAVQGGGGAGDIHLHVHATDAESVRRLFESNGPALAAALRRQLRKGALA